VRARLLLAIALGGLSGLSAGAWASSAPSYDVRYRFDKTVYLDAGTADGLSMGEKLTVFSGSAVVGELEVVYVADHSASTQIISEKRPVKPGDKAKPLNADVVSSPSAPAAADPKPAPTAAAAASATSAPATKEPAPPPTPAPATPALAKPAQPLARVHGGVALSYYKTVDRSDSGFDFTERSSRVDLTASQIGGLPLSFALRMRGRQDIRVRALTNGVPQSESDNRLYEAALRYQARNERISLEVGRIGASYFSGIGWLDGASAAFGVLPHVQLGGFFGRRADVFGLGFNGSGAKYGGFARVAPIFSPNWRGEALLAVVHEDADGDVSREYASLEGWLHAGTRLSFFQRAEVDWNRGWRAIGSTPTYQLSNLSLSTQVRLWSLSSLSISYDGRRRYRTYLDRLTPEDLFDSRMREGVTANLMLAARSGARVTAGGGLRSLEGSSGAAYYANFGLAHDGLVGRRVSVGLDASGYRNDFTEGLLVIARTGRRFGHGHSIDLSGGGSFYRMRATDATRRTEWGRLSLRGELGHGLYLMSDGEYDFGDDLSGPRLMIELGWRF
jgi:hypothetical protein